MNIQYLYWSVIESNKIILIFVHNIMNGFGIHKFLSPLKSFKNVIDVSIRVRLHELKNKF